MSKLSAGALATLAIFALPSAAIAESRTLPLSDFIGIDLASGIKAAATPGAAFTVTAQSPRQGDIQDLRTSVEGGVLRAWYDWSIFHIFDFAGRDVTLLITMPELDTVMLTGGASLAATSVPGDELKIDVSGGARATLNGTAAKRYSINASGGASVTLSGTCYNAAFAASGGASLEARDLVCADVTGAVSGGAHANMTATASVSADVSGGAALAVYGHPAITKVNSSSGGRVDFPN
jgi:Putative auto-transporter adhesin, head GIN domain